MLMVRVCGVATYLLCLLIKNSRPLMLLSLSSARHLLYRAAKLCANPHEHFGDLYHGHLLLVHQICRAGRRGEGDGVAM